MILVNNKIKGSKALRYTAIAILTITSFIFLSSLVLMGFGVSTGVFIEESRSDIVDKFLNSFCLSYSNEVTSDTFNSEKLQNDFLKYKIIDYKGDTIYSNLTDDFTWDYNQTTKFRNAFVLSKYPNGYYKFNEALNLQNDFDKKILFYDEQSQKIVNEYYSQIQKSYSEYGEHFVTEYNYDEESYSDVDFEDSSNTEIYAVTQEYTVSVFLNKALMLKNTGSTAWQCNTVISFINNVGENRIAITWAFFLSMFISLVLLAFVLSSAGHNTKDDNIRLSIYDKFPLDLLVVIFLICVAAAFALFIYTMNIDYYYLINNTAFDIKLAAQLIIPIFSLICCFVIFFGISIINTMAVRIKSKTFFSSMLIYKVLRLIKRFVLFLWRKIKSFFKFIGYVISHIPLVGKVAIASAVLFFVLTVFIIGFPAAAILLLFLLFCIVIIVSMVLKRVEKGTEEIANGNVQYKIDLKYMHGNIKRHTENINNIGDGIAKAVDQRLKSERFKTELITNVSHDIKTPLTSIINYVDLLKKESIDNEKANEYIDVLSRQSIRLKKLIEDLIEASKASSGVLAVNFTSVDLPILLTQLSGEYDEKFKNSGIDIVLNSPESAVARADSRHLWRVFDNVLNNIVKYTMPNTRVYVDVIPSDDGYSVIFKNISKDPLNISGDELMERFVRGDSSRNTEGSGLGLSIAKSLTELQKGKFVLEIDGDLFKVVITLPKN